MLVSGRVLSTTVILFCQIQSSVDLCYLGGMELQWRFLPILEGMNNFFWENQHHGNSMSSQVKEKVIHEASIC